MATPLRPAHLREIMPNIPQRDEVTEFPACCEVMRRFGVTNKKRAAAWLANVAKESGELHCTEEIASGAAYEGRRDLGNTEKGDGVRFKGRGYIQITGRANYARIANDLGVRCVAAPDLLKQMPHRWTTAGYYWQRMSSLGNLNLVADAGNFERTVLGVRGGPDASRRAYYERAMRVLPNDLSIPDPIKAALDNAGGSPAARPASHDGTPPKKEGSQGSGLILPRPSNLHDPRSGWYVNAHPTHYRFRPDVRALVLEYLNHPKLKGKIWITTYFDHPPGWGLDAVSFDVWDWDGRGHALDPELGSIADEIIFNDPDGPRLWWRIYKGWMWNDTEGFVRWDPPKDGSDAGHWKHGHYTFR